MFIRQITARSKGSTFLGILIIIKHCRKTNHLPNAAEAVNTLEKGETGPLWVILRIIRGSLGCNQTAADRQMRQKASEVQNESVWCIY